MCGRVLILPDSLFSKLILGQRLLFPKNQTGGRRRQVVSNYYRAYGINIKSAIRLPDLIKYASPTDANIRYGQISDALVDFIFGAAEVFERPGCKIRATPGEMYIEWQRVGKILVRRGAEVIVEPDRSCCEEDLQPFLTGPVLSVLLQQRGFFVLHASAVEINGAAVAFLGAKGDGKSTLAAHLQARGHRLISDDIVPVDPDDDRSIVFPGFPRINLFGDSIAAVGEQPENYPLLHKFVEKRSFKHRDKFSTEPISLRCLYVLSENEKVGLEITSPASAFMEITRHTYLNRYLKALDCQPEHFRQCRKLLQKIPVLKLHRPHNFAVMDEVCGLIENHFSKAAH